MNEFNQVDTLVDQVKGNSNFLQRILFGRMTLITVGIASALFLIAAMTAN